MSATRTSDYCLTCLSTTRKLYPIADGKFFACLTLLKLSDASKFTLCWECNSFVYRAMQFRKKALEAFAIMSDMGKKMVNHIELSTLSCRNLNHSLSITTHTPDLKPKTLKLYPVPQDAHKELHLKEEQLRFEEQDNPLGMTAEHDIKGSDQDVADVDPLLKSEVDDDDGESSNGIEKGTMPIKTTRLIAPKPPPVIKLIRLPPGPIPKYLKPVPVPPKIFKCVTKSLKPKKKDLKLVPIENVPREYFQKNVPKNVHEEHFTKNVPEEHFTKNVPEEHCPKNVQKEYFTKNVPEEHFTKNVPEEHFTKNVPEEHFTKNVPEEHFTKYVPEEHFTKNVQEEYFPESTSQENDKVRGKYIIKMLTEESLKAMRLKRFKEAKENRFKYFCYKCMEFFKTKTSLDGHMDKHVLSTGDLVCRVCEMKLVTEDLLTIHTNAHFRIIICSLCSEEFSSYNKFVYHYKWNHDETSIECKKCNFAFTNRKLWKKHVRAHNNTRVTCPLCHKLVRNDVLKTHIRAHAPQPILTCDECGKKLRGRLRLYQHKKKEHPHLKDGEAYCAECNVQYKNKFCYQTHLKQSSKHVQEKQQCPECGKEFSCAVYLKAHIERQHAAHGYKCEQCQLNLTSSRALSRHIMRVHERIEPPKNKMCDICGRSFATIAILRQHRNGHLNIRPYKCKECGDTFSYSGAMYTHVKLKHRREKREKKKT